MAEEIIGVYENWDDSFKKLSTKKEEEGLPSQIEFFDTLASPKWDDIKDTVDRASNAFAFDGFDPLLMARIISKMAVGGTKQIAALVVLALEVGSLTSSPKVISKEAADNLIAAFGVQKSAPGDSKKVTLPRVILAFPGYAFQIISHRKVSPKVTIPYWPNELSFPGSINVLTTEAQTLLLDAYNMWSVVFGLTISQGTRNNRNKKVVEELNKILSGNPVSDLTWSDTMQFSNVARKTRILKGSHQHTFCNQLVKYADGLARCMVAAKMKCVASINLPPEEVQKAKDTISGVLSKQLEV